VVSWEIGKLVPSDKNAKLHPENEVLLLSKSIKRYGIANPLNVKPNGEIITGHGRRLAALLLGWTHIPVIVRTDLTDSEADALRISDNSTAGRNYDTELLQAAVAEMSEMGEVDMDTLGFGEVELAKLTQPFEDMDMGAFVSDITEAVETQKTENTASEAAVDSTAAPVGDALGFKRVTIEQSRRVRAFMNVIEGKTGKSGAEALVAYIDELGIAA
jgi:hypothetical protein